MTYGKFDDVVELKLALTEDTVDVVNELDFVEEVPFAVWVDLDDEEIAW